MNFLIPKNLAKTSGIYCITNTVTQKIYVGSASDFKHRFNCHLTDLHRGVHPNDYFQKAYKKYGSENFNFEILEMVDIENLIIQEQFHLDNTQCYLRSIGYNICKIAGKVNMTAEVRKKISDKRMGHEVTAHTRSLISKANKGRIVTEEQLLKIRAAAEKRIDIPRLDVVKRKISESKQANPYIYTDSVKQSMKDAYENNREYRLDLLAQARTKLIGRKLPENLQKEAELAALKNGLKSRAVSDKQILELIHRFRLNTKYSTKDYGLELGVHPCLFSTIFKITQHTPIYLPILFKIGFIQVGGKSIRDLKNSEFCAKLDLNIEFSEGSDNLITNAVELYNFLTDIKE